MCTIRSIFYGVINMSIDQSMILLILKDLLGNGFTLSFFINLLGNRFTLSFLIYLFYFVE
jgi:hypothetical protein